MSAEMVLDSFERLVNLVNSRGIVFTTHCPRQVGVCQGKVAIEIAVGPASERIAAYHQSMVDLGSL